MTNEPEVRLELIDPGSGYPVTVWVRADGSSYWDLRRGGVRPGERSYAARRDPDLGLDPNRGVVEAAAAALREQLDNQQENT